MTKLRLITKDMLELGSTEALQAWLSDARRDLKFSKTMEARLLKELRKRKRNSK